MSPRPSAAIRAVQIASPDDVVIVSALRTPITRAKKGGLKDTPADDLLATLLKATVERTGLDPIDVGDVVVGSVLGRGRVTLSMYKPCHALGSTVLGPPCGFVSV